MPNPETLDFEKFTVDRYCVKDAGKDFDAH